MTSLAFILSVAPLAVATGAGAEMRQSLGTAVLFVVNDLERAGIGVVDTDLLGRELVLEELSHADVPASRHDRACAPAKRTDAVARAVEIVQ
jgi:AcrB/AcrD/AcrF family